MTNPEQDQLLECCETLIVDQSKLGHLAFKNYEPVVIEVKRLSLLIGESEHEFTLH